LGEQIKQDEMGRACGTYGREEICIQGNVKQTDHLEYLCVYGTIILKWILKKWDDRG
jgi:hypothetical protein